MNKNPTKQLFGICTSNNNKNINPTKKIIKIGSNLVIPKSILIC